MGLLGRKFTFKPRTVSDTLDGTNTPPGAMEALVNLVPSPFMKNAFTPRPAAVVAATFTSFDVNASTITDLFVLGNIAYGLVSSTSLGSNLDRPFAYDLVNNVFQTITGVTAASLPAAQGTTGDWTPPTVAMIDSRIVFTHPGFAGASTGRYIGWLDLSGFVSTSLSVNTSNGSAILSSVTGDGTSAPIIDGVRPGYTVVGTGIPANATVVSVVNGTFNENTTASTNATVSITGIPSTAGMASGMYISGGSIPAGAVINSVTSSSTLSISASATATATGVNINVSGGGSITINANATATATQISLTISGGTTSSPQWASGNMNVNGFAAVPVAVANFNNRAYYAVNNAAVFSDVLNPTNQTNATQVLTLGDTTPVTALAGLPLSNQVTGGILQSLIAFKGSEILYQISGDAALNNLFANAINGSVGTLAPNSISATPLGLAFIAPDGMRILDITARTTQPIGARGEGVNVPFLDVLFPSRMEGEYNQNVYRISLQNGGLSGQPFQEYWYDFNDQIWTGPHTFTYGLLNAYEASSGAELGYGFVGAATGIGGKLWYTGCFPTLHSVYTENGVPLSFQFLTSLLPDNEDMSMNAVIETSIAMALPGAVQVTVIAMDDLANLLDTVVISGSGVGATLWGGFNWGAAPWGAGSANFRQNQVFWHNPLVFKQGQINITGYSTAGYTIGNVYIRAESLGYFIEGAVLPPGAPVGQVAGIVVTGSTLIQSNITGYFVAQTSASTITLPQFPNLWEIHTISDAVGNASTYAITVNGNGANIDGHPTYVMNFNYQSVTVQWDGLQWKVL